jgi:hypothetical protein
MVPRAGMVRPNYLGVQGEFTGQNNFGFNVLLQQGLGRSMQMFSGFLSESNDGKFWAK